MTLIGFVIGLVVVCFFAYMGMILVPAYSEFYGVKKAMDTVAAAQSPTSTDQHAIAKALDKQFLVGYVESVTGSDIKLIREKRGNLIEADYEVRKGFVYNIEFAVKFKHTAPLGGGKSIGD
jgi:hypothetical protein